MKRPDSRPKGTAIVVLGSSALDLARRLKSVLPQSEIHGYAPRVPAADVPFTQTAAHLSGLFRARTPILGLCSTGILIRSLASALGDKHDEAPVIAMSEDGRTVVPLLGGHRGGHALAHAAASLTGGAVAITSASDLRLGVALDDPPPGWRIANLDMVPPVSAALLAGDAVRLVVEAGSAGWLPTAHGAFQDNGALAIRVTDRVPNDYAASLIYHPPVLALGVGCARNTEPEELRRLVFDTLAAHSLAPDAVATVVSIDLKSDEPAVHDVARALGVPARFFDAPRLEEERPRLANPSEAVFRETGCHGVAEGAALAAAGPEGLLVVPKTKSANATCAVARARSDIAALDIGRARGRLSIVGIGPGDHAWRSPEATAALRSATDIVGYRLYLDLLGTPSPGQRRHGSALGEEVDRARLALDLAAEGRDVALISSGDAGIYGLAALVFELLEHKDSPSWRRIAIEVIPGLSAMQAAAARAGAPLGHDFAVLSLSDLLTPWSEIERRLSAAAQADFVLCLYNPASLRRRAPLEHALSILRAHRAAATPVIVARNLGRQGEKVTTTILSELQSESVDMLSIIIVGNSRTRIATTAPTRWVYTPRGYAVNDPAEPDAATSAGDRAPGRRHVAR
ncbi:MAG: precorrin-3B C(17)-methyltransferase [Alphaproteobacteria bacterium]